MTQARIQIDSVTGSNPPNGTAILVGATVSVTNVNNGGESTYLWEFLDKPEGSSASFINPNIQSTTFIPDVEGTYLLRLTVNRTLADERTDTQIVGCNTVRSGLRLPAAGETTQASTSRGWALAVNRILRKVDALLSDPGVVVGYTSSGCNRGDIVKVGNTDTLLSGLPDEVVVPRFVAALASDSYDVRLPLYVVEEDIDGNTSISPSTIIRCRRYGLFGPLVGSPTAEDPVYVDDSGAVSLTAGTYTRQIGHAVNPSGGNYYLAFDGAVNTSGPSVLAPYVLNTNTAVSGLASALLLQALTSTLNLKSANSGIVPFKITRYDSGTTVDFARFANESGNTLLAVNSSGNLRWASDGRISSSGSGLALGFNGSDYWNIDNSGDLTSLNNTNIKDLADPVDAQDAATKAYTTATVNAYPQHVWQFGNSVSDTAECSLDPGFGVRTAPSVGGAYPLAIVPVAGVIRGFRVRCTGAPTGAAQEVQLVINGSPHATVGSLTTGGGSPQSISVTLATTQSVSAGDTIAIRLKPSGVVLTGATEVTASVVQTAV